MTAATTTHAFAERMVALGRDLGYTQGLHRANKILRAHGIAVDHPARIEIFNELMTGYPPLPAPAILDEA